MNKIELLRSSKQEFATLISMIEKASSLDDIIQYNIERIALIDEYFASCEKRSNNLLDITKLDIIELNNTMRRMCKKLKINKSLFHRANKEALLGKRNNYYYNNYTQYKGIYKINYDVKESNLLRSL